MTQSAPHPARSFAARHPLPASRGEGKRSMPRVRAPGDNFFEKKVIPARKTCRIMPAPRSTRGASRGVLECGSGAVVSEGCNTHTRAETAEAARSRCTSPCVAGALGGGAAGEAHRRSAAEAPIAVVRPCARATGGA
jgi:hypothetical protein